MTLGVSTNWPVTGPTSIQNTIPAYLYLQYQDDDNVAAFFTAYNQYSQAYINWFNQLNLPIYTQAPISGSFLDFVGQSIYGIIRPQLAVSGGTLTVGDVNTFTVNSLTFNGFSAGTGYANLTSTTSATIGTGSYTFTVSTPATGSAFSVGNQVSVASASNLANYMQGYITAYTGTSMTITVTSTGGSGTFANWVISLANTSTSDDTYRRIITWAFYKGDGKVFTPTWLKRRINRFLNGANGTDVVNDTQYNISVVPTGFKQWTITLPVGIESNIFAAAVITGAIELPIQITWTVVVG